MEKQLGKPVVITNRGGAMGTLSVGQLARQKPDGYQIGLTVDSTALASDRITLSWKDMTANEEQFVVEHVHARGSDLERGRIECAHAKCFPGRYPAIRVERKSPQNLVLRVYRRKRLPPPLRQRFKRLQPYCRIAAADAIRLKRSWKPKRPAQGGKRACRG